nr:MAG TPA: hypothetical protein [Caudoviricetes sp.]
MRKSTKIPSSFTGFATFPKREHFSQQLCKSAALVSG